MTRSDSSQRSRSCDWNSMKSRTPPETGLDLKDTSRAAANIAQAKGIGTDAGNPGFPFNFGRQAQESRGSDRL